LCLGVLKMSQGEESIMEAKQAAHAPAALIRVFQKESDLTTYQRYYNPDKVIIALIRRDWCPPCMILEPSWDRLVKFFTDARHPALLAELDVQGFPRMVERLAATANRGTPSFAIIPPKSSTPEDWEFVEPQKFRDETFLLDGLMRAFQVVSSRVRMAPKQSILQRIIAYL